ncbi:L-amino acid oxidase [Podospora didyma]|uniref:L-amino acid oxidase n=1 Tax=Podospora didyma TaxID=330526 RepID=A0AAE0K2U8_9PEZI|nr:L-amino acid oxidase [Podospora didyma]
MALRFTNMPAEKLPLPPPGVHPREVIANTILREYLGKKSGPNGGHLAILVDKWRDDSGVTDSGPYTGKVRIVGAGAAGLYIAMTLNFLGIDFDIVEASDNVGGRCATKSFKDVGPDCAHNYYDMGATRIPNIDSMNSTLNLIRNPFLLNIKNKLVDYVYRVYTVDSEGVTTYYEPFCYWYQNEAKFNADKYEAAIGDVLALFQQPIDKTNPLVQPYFTGGNDKYSTRDYLMMGPMKLPIQNLTYAETKAGELADSYNFNDFIAASKKNWFRVEGGMSVVTDTMAACVKSTEWPPKTGGPSIDVTLSTPVLAMSLTPDGESIQVTTGGKALSTNSYDMVFNTTALGPLQHMDLSGLHLGRDILDGIRVLSYDRATKVAVKFNTRCDLPLGYTVYRSWDDGDGTNVLIVSYTWAQDAARMAALVPDYTNPSTPAPKFTDPIAALCLEGLVKLWQGKKGAPTLSELQGYYATHHAWAWSHDPYTCGAFALFGPGQFENVWPPLKLLHADSRLAICGEASSVYHAGISGALDSAYFAVTTFLAERATKFPDMIDKAKKLVDSAFNLGPKPFENGGRILHPERDDVLARWCAPVSAMK